MRRKFIKIEVADIVEVRPTYGDEKLKSHSCLDRCGLVFYAPFEWNIGTALWMKYLVPSTGVPAILKVEVVASEYVSAQCGTLVAVAVKEIQDRKMKTFYEHFIQRGKQMSLW